MAKRVSAAELVWLITDALREELGPHFATSLAVVSDEKVGWRSVIASPSAEFRERLEQAGYVLARGDRRHGDRLRVASEASAVVRLHLG